MTLSPIELSLIDRWQRDFPLTARPFAVVAEEAGLDERAAIDIFASLRRKNAMSRIGAVVRPHTIGTSTLAAMRVPPERLDEVAAIVSAQQEVNHNYERDHAFNLWFVVTGPDHDALLAAIGAIEKETGLPLMSLPMVKAYHLDLGFALKGRGERIFSAPPAVPYQPDPRDRTILAAIEDGLPLVPRPYQAVAETTGLAEQEVVDRLKALRAAGIVTRFGCVVRHRTLGYTANAMAVWDVPDDIIDGVAARIIANPDITLCYQRPRQPPHWPYNLFCMVHARTRAEAMAAIAEINATCGTAALPQDVLFSMRCFKQRGATFSPRAEALH